MMPANLDQNCSSGNNNNSQSREAQADNFASPQEEIAFLKLKLEECQQEFLEFQESSRDLETEYETQIKQLEKKNYEAVNQISRLEDENDNLKTRYNAYASDTQHKLNEYQQQIAELTTLNDRLTAYIRELEQSNDDLERAQRALAASLEDFEVQLNQQIERNVLLENEVSEKEELECVVQRLKEEARDLRHELIVNKNSSESARRKQLMIDNHLQMTNSLQSISPTQSSALSSQQEVEAASKKLEQTLLNGTSSSPTATTDDKNDSQLDSPTAASNGSTATRAPNVDSTTRSPMTPPRQTTPSRFSFASPFSYTKSSISPTKSTDSKSQQTSTPSSPKMPSIVMSPSTRISALNIVSDLLRKVGALESRLASAKKVTS